MKMLPRIALLMAVTCAFNSARAEDWPSFRGPRGDGSWNAPKLAEKFPDAVMKRVWQQTIGGGYSGVTAANGHVFTMDFQATPEKSERVLCFDAGTGKQLWTHTYAVDYGKMDHATGPRSAPTIADGRVYTLGTMGHIRCLEEATGKVLWAKDGVAELQARIPKWGLAASPVVDGDLVIFHVGAEKNGCYIALDRKTGAEVWRAGTDPAGYATPIIIEHAGVRELICWTPENVCGIEVRTGKIFWSVPYKSTYGVSISSPIFHDGIVLVSGYWEGSLSIQLGAKPADAHKLWDNPRNLRAVMAQPLYREGCGFMVEKYHGLCCFELKTGNRLWKDGNKLTPKESNSHATLISLNDGDRALALNSAGELVLFHLSKADYKEDSRAKLLGNTWAHPAFSGNRVFARDDKELVCAELPVK